MHTLLRSAVLRRIILILLCGVTLVALWKSTALLWHETLGTYYGDINIYLALGRGLLNGLTPYTDLFETKPPGMFLLSALSLWLFDGAALLLWVEATLLAILPIGIVFPVMGMRGRGTAAPLQIAVLFGIFLTLYVGEAAGQGLSESFAAVFAVAAVAMAAMTLFRRGDSGVSAGMTILMSVLLFAAVFIKEPFLLSIFGGTLLVSPSFRSMLRMLPPLAIAGALFLLGLLLTGTLAAYFTVYLNHMLGHQIAVPWGVVPDPLWLRTIHLPRLWAALSAFSGFAPFVIFPLWIAALVAMVLGADPGRPRLLAALQWLIGSWFLTLSIGISGDFYGHHFVFAVPGYAALFLVCMRERETLLSTFTGKVATTAWVVFLSVGIVLHPTAALTLPSSWTVLDQERRTAAAVIDDVLDRCDVDRYLLLIANNDGIHGYTKHSPYGPLFTQYPRLISGLPLFLETFTQQFHTAPIAVDKAGEPRPLLDEASVEEFRTAFTDEPPACAGEGFAQPAPYRVLFRVN